MEKWLRLAAALALACSVCACKKLKEMREGPGGPLPFGERGTEPAGVEGKYTGSGTNPDGGSYECDVTVSRKGDAYAVTWYFDGRLGYEGSGIMKGNTFVVGFAGPQGYGVVAYAVKADGSLDGTWAGKGSSKLGTEKLTRE